MSKVIALFGAGHGWSYQIARKYAQNEYHIALVSRSQSKLDELTKRLESEVPNAKSTTYAVDIAVHANVNNTISSILATHKFVDVVYFGPGPSNFKFTPAAKLTIEDAQENTNLYFVAGVNIVQGFLPSMLERKSGAFVVGAGTTSVIVRAGLSGPGPALAAVRNYIMCLNEEVKDKGLFAGIVLVGSVIKGSDYHSKLPAGNNYPTLDPALLADIVWDVVNNKEPERLVQ